MRDDRQRCVDMLEAIQKIEQKCIGMREGQADEMLHVWIIYHLQIIGEAAYKISDEFKKQQPGIAWSKIIGTRHILVHGYFQTDVNLLWQTIQEDLPLLKEQLVNILDN
jgi:uncharacterized protein with HEPN domain